MGWKTGFEPATSGTTIRRSNLLSYNHHFTECKYTKKPNHTKGYNARFIGPEGSTFAP